MHTPSTGRPIRTIIKWPNIPFYAFNKDNIKHVTQLKQGECLASVFVKHDVIIPKFSEYFLLKWWNICPWEMLAKQVLKPLLLYC